jgi:hypothetical protein
MDGYASPGQLLELNNCLFDLVDALEEKILHMQAQITALQRTKYMLSRFPRHSVTIKKHSIPKKAVATKKKGTVNGVDDGLM